MEGVRDEAGSCRALRQHTMYDIGGHLAEQLPCIEDTINLTGNRIALLRMEGGRGEG